MSDKLKLGFFYYPTDDDLILGHPRLDVNVYSKPTEDHFDPDQLSVPIIGIDDNFEDIKITHPWHGFLNYKVRVGHIIISDRYDKKIEAFIFGGNLSITQRETLVHCTISSPAPIIPMINESSPEFLFVCEFEALLARLRTNYDSDIDFEKKLIDIDPITLLTAGLISSKDRLINIPAAHQDYSYRETLQIVEYTIKSLKDKGKWPAKVSPLDILLET